MSDEACLFSLNWCKQAAREGYPGASPFVVDRHSKEEIFLELPLGRRANICLELSPNDLKKATAQQKHIQSFEQMTEALEEDEEVPALPTSQVFQCGCIRRADERH